MYRTTNFTFNIKGKILENPLTDLVADLDTLPVPDRSVIYDKNEILAQFPLKAFFAGRGCPFNCSYCFNHAYNRMYQGKGRILRLKSVKYLINEIKDVRNNYPMKFIKFHDDIFGLDMQWLAEFADIYPKEVGLPFLSYSRANIIKEEYCRLLKKAGCYSTSLAFEVGNEKLRNTVLHRNMTDTQIIEGCKTIKKYGIRIYSLNMVGLPGETEADMIQTIKLNQKIGVDYADASIFQPYPGTDLTRYSIEQGFLDSQAHVYESQFSKSVLNYPQPFKDMIYIIHKLFPLIADVPQLTFLIHIAFRVRSVPFLMQLLNYFYRFYYGYFLHKRIYGFTVPLPLRVKIALPILFSRNRS